MNDSDISNLPSEAQIVYEATKESVIRARRALLVISGLIGLGFVHLFVWYGSWELARIEGRQAAIDKITSENQKGNVITGRESDRAAVEKLQLEIKELETRWDYRELQVPLINLRVASADFSVAILLMSGAVLLWLWFAQRRLNACLMRLERLEGWAIVGPVLEFHFMLIGSHASPLMRRIAQLLVLGLPILAICFLGSDCVDLYLFWRHPLHRFYFSSSMFVIRVMLRLAVGTGLAVIVTLIGWECFKELRQSEEDLLRYSGGPFGRSDM